MEEREKTATEILEEVKIDMCNHYCKWPDLWDEEKEEAELIESEYCQNCPLNRI